MRRWVAHGQVDNSRAGEVSGFALPSSALPTFAIDLPVSNKPIMIGNVLAKTKASDQVSIGRPGFRDIFDMRSQNNDFAAALVMSVKGWISA